MKNVSDHRYAVILAGGRGTRLWPISTADQPKQFQALGDSRPLIAQTFDRLAKCLPAERIFVATTEAYAQDVTEALPDLRQENFVLEPRPIGKAAAFLLVCAELTSRDPHAVLLYAAADSSVSPDSAFVESCHRAFAFVEAHRTWTVLLGVKPTRPDTSLGYIRANGSAMGDDGVRVLRDFHEKPSHDSAGRFTRDDQYYWNSSHYCFAAETWLEAYSQSAPALTNVVLSYWAAKDPDAYQPTQPINQELVPLVDAGWPIGVLDGGFAWHDVGTWPSLYRALADAKQSSFVKSGSVIDNGSKSGLVINNSGNTVVTCGIEGLAVIVSNGVVFVARIEELEERPADLVNLQRTYESGSREGGSS